MKLGSTTGRSGIFAVHFGCVTVAASHHVGARPDMACTVPTHGADPSHHGG
jgi:hypothetical protein